jgi:DNA-binding SARP family transcriptional activator/tetratricopeptide (TPR) repeat protein
VASILVLGPVEVRHGDRALVFARQQERFILGVLALEVCRPVSTDRLIDLLWGDNPPRSARAVLQTRVSELRTALTSLLGGAASGDGPAGDVDGVAVTIESRRSAYVLMASEQIVDAYVFLRQAREWRAAATPSAGRDLLRSALGLWRGPVLGETDRSSALSVRQMLESARLTALEDLFELELGLGNHGAVADEILRLPTEDRTRERLVELAMIAQFRSGRAAEALRTFDRWRRWLDDELGATPGGRIAEIHRAILRNVDPDLVPAPTQPLSGPTALDRADSAATFIPTVPRTLPADVHTFAGREQELASLADMLGTSGESVVSITGPPGVGKTALSLRVAHDLAGEFPDGQLFADLRGADKRAAAEPHEILARFLRALGVQTAPGATLEDQVDMYRTVLADRNVLVILDNVRDDVQIEPLIPPGPGNRVIVNGRSRMHSGAATRTIDLHVLDEDGAVDLLKLLVGGRRIDDEPLAARDLIQLCGQLTLALRIVGARLRARPHWTIERLARTLREERPRLDQFTHGHLDVRVSIGLSYRDLSADAKLLLGSMADLDLVHLSLWAAAALLDSTLSDAEQVLDEIFDAHLADVVGHDAVGPHHQIHDLVRAYAHEQSETEEIAGRLLAARQRLYGVYEYVATSVNKRVTSGIYVGPLETSGTWIPDVDVATVLARDPSRWFETERPHVLTLVRRAAADGDDGICCALVRLTWTLFEMRRYFEDWLAIVETSYSAAEHSQNPIEVASVKLIRAVALSETRRYDEGRIDLADSAAIFRAVGDRAGLGSVLAYRGVLDRLENNTSSAVVQHDSGVSELAGAGDAAAFGLAARYLGQAHLALGHDNDAEEWFATALDAYRSVDVRLGEAQVLVHQGFMFVSRGELDRATQQFEQALCYVREIGDLAGTAQCLRALAAADRARGDVDGARAKLTEALKIVRQPKPTLFERIVSNDLQRLDEVAAGRSG